MTQRTKRLYKKMNATKSWFLEKINKIDTPLARSSGFEKAVAEKYIQVL